jgi:hypothetical protein
MAGMKFGLKAVRNVLMCDNWKYLGKVLRIEIGFTEAVLPFLKMGTTAACFQWVGKIRCELPDIENKSKNRYWVI